GGRLLQAIGEDLLELLLDDQARDEREHVDATILVHFREEDADPRRCRVLALGEVGLLFHQSFTWVRAHCTRYHVAGAATTSILTRRKFASAAVFISRTPAMLFPRAEISFRSSLKASRRSSIFSFCSSSFL